MHRSPVTRATLIDLAPFTHAGRRTPDMGRGHLTRGGLWSIHGLRHAYPSPGDRTTLPVKGNRQPYRGFALVVVDLPGFIVVGAGQRGIDRDGCKARSIFGCDFKREAGGFDLDDPVLDFEFA